MGESGPSPAQLAVSREDVMDLVGQVCALSRSGVGAREAWQALAHASGPSGAVAEIVAAMVAVGGTVADGLRLAAGRSSGSGRAALGWLALTVDVGHRCGAPTAPLLEEVGEALLAELTHAGEREVALAASTATGTVLAAMPLLGLVLGVFLGVNPVAVLLGTWPGRGCLVAAALLWAAGRWWYARLVAAAVRAGR